MTSYHTVTQTLQHPVQRPSSDNFPQNLLITLGGSQHHHPNGTLPWAPENTEGSVLPSLLLEGDRPSATFLHYKAPVVNSSDTPEGETIMEHLLTLRGLGLTRGPIDSTLTGCQATIQSALDIWKPSLPNRIAKRNTRSPRSYGAKTGPSNQISSLFKKKQELFQKNKKPLVSYQVDR